MADEKDPPLFTPKQIAVLQPFIDRPDRIDMLVDFTDNMLAAKRMARLMAWGFGFFAAIAALWYSVSNSAPLRGWIK